jgi:hypothetical protein
MDDKRTQVRLRIPNGRVRYKNALAFGLFHTYIGPGELLDISKSGAGFIIGQPLDLEELIKVKIHIPGEKSLILRGQVRWVEADTGSGRHRVGMQFAPYGYRRDYNSPNKLTRLGRLGEIYH